MEDTAFWALIESHVRIDADSEVELSALQDALSQLAPTEIADFG